MAMSVLLVGVMALTVKCSLLSEDPSPPMFVTLSTNSDSVQVTMAGQTYMEDTFADGSLIWWQVKSRDGTLIRYRLNRVDGSLMITNEHVSNGSKSNIVRGFCVKAKNKF